MLQQNTAMIRTDTKQSPMLSMMAVTIIAMPEINLSHKLMSITTSIKSNRRRQKRCERNDSIIHRQSILTKKETEMKSYIYLSDIHANYEALKHLDELPEM